MAKRGAKSRGRRGPRSKKPRLTWLAASLAVGIEFDVAVLVDLGSGETLGAGLIRPAGFLDFVVGQVASTVIERGSSPAILRVDRESMAVTLRSKLEGMAVGFGLDRRALGLIEAAVLGAGCLRERSLCTLAGGEKMYTLKVELNGVTPPVWRRVCVAGDVSLATLHYVLQGAMGWSNCHLHEFRVGGIRYGDPEHSSEGVRSQDAAQLEAVLAVGGQAEYWYDFGDDWKHALTVESVAEARPGDPVASCVGGARACPPEDSGGPWGYEDKLRAFAADDSDDSDAIDERDELRAWLGDDFDPESFDVELVNRRLESLLAIGGDDEDRDEDDEGWDEDGWEDDDEIPCLYDADRAPVPAEWLELDEHERMLYVRSFHARNREGREHIERPLVHALGHVIIENQLAIDEPVSVRTTLERLAQEGLDRHRAIHAIASVMLELMEVLNLDPDAPFDEPRYTRKLGQLSASECSAADGTS